MSRSLTFSAGRLERDRRHCVFHCAFFSCWLLVSAITGASSSWAQSSVVELPGESDSGNDVVPVTPGRISTSLTPGQRHAEQMLARPTPASWRNEIRMGELVQQMNQAGFQVFLDETASDNRLDEDTLIRLALHHSSIAVNLEFALHPYQCNFQITESGVIQILSEDGLLDTPSNVTYNVRQLAPDFSGLEELMELIRESVDPDGWEFNGGIGRIQPFSTSQGYLLNIYQTWPNHRRVRRQLETALRMGGGGLAQGNGDIRTSNGVSQSIMLPEEYLALRRNRRGLALPGSGTTGGFGGGAGLGGGVF